MSLPSMPHRPIRSFVRREGHMTPAQKRALSELWPRYGVDDADAPLDFEALFARRAPVFLEIGFGSGETLAHLAALYPDHDYLGIEVYRPGAGRLLRRLDEGKIANVRVLIADAAQAIAQRIKDASLDAALIYFPDPWPKKRHHKRRLVQGEFVARLRRKLKAGGMLRFATDWQAYAEHMMAVLSAAEGFENIAGPGCYAGRGERPLTRFERRGEGLGHRVWDLAFRRVD